MAFDGTDACWIPRVPYQKEAAQRLRIAQFGDGYEQRMLDGINSLDLQWNLSFDMKPKADIDAMDLYLAGRLGDAFPFYDVVTNRIFQVFCDEWSIEWQYRKPAQGSEPVIFYGTLNAVFRRANGNAIQAVVS